MTGRGCLSKEGPLGLRLKKEKDGGGHQILNLNYRHSAVLEKSIKA